MIVVTGSAGHLGEALMRVLRARAIPARGIDIKPSPFTDCVGSILDADFVLDSLRGASAVVHAATLHKPHLATHTERAFIETNVLGTLNLLKASASAGVQAFIFTSTTSTFGSALSPAAGQPAVWVTEELRPRPKNIYGLSKLMAEDLCELSFRRSGLPLLVLRTSRFFPEADDDAQIRDAYDAENAQANELLYRRADIEDVVEAHLLALEHAPTIGFGTFIISATVPFRREHLAELRQDAPAVLRRLFPDWERLYAGRCWKMFPKIDRVYVNRRAVETLGWSPKCDFAYVLSSLRAGVDFRSALARTVGAKGYHATTFAEGPYPVEGSNA